MVRIPLELIYIYDPDRKLYERVGTHHTLTIKEYEKLEAEYARQAEIRVRFGVGMAMLTIIFLIGLFIWK